MCQREGTDAVRGSMIKSTISTLGFLLGFFVFVFVFGLFRAALAAYGGSQARGQIGAVAADLHHSSQ